MRIGIQAFPLFTVCGLAACAVGPNTSYVAALSAPTDATVIAASIGSFLCTQLPAASTTIALDSTPTAQANNPLTPVLANSLRQHGFAVAQSGVPTGSHTLRYWVTPLDASGELVRLMIDDRKLASQFFVRNTVGTLESGGPFTVAQVEASR
jgi:hypothetical protein